VHLGLHVQLLKQEQRLSLTTLPAFFCCYCCLFCCFCCFFGGGVLFFKLVILFIYISNVIPLPNFLSTNPLYVFPPSLASMRVLLHPPTHLPTYPPTHLPTYPPTHCMLHCWGIHPSQDQGHPILLMSDKAILPI
jgi:hypothetical protein